MLARVALVKFLSEAVGDIGDDSREAAYLVDACAPPPQYNAAGV